jgi:hypothetical protein
MPIQIAEQRTSKFSCYRGYYAVLFEFRRYFLTLADYFGKPDKGRDEGSLKAVIGKVVENKKSRCFEQPDSTDPAVVHVFSSHATRPLGGYLLWNPEQILQCFLAPACASTHA